MREEEGRRRREEERVLMHRRSILPYLRVVGVLQTQDAATCALLLFPPSLTSPPSF